MFSTPENKAQGISAVKALAIASAEGQKIFTITQQNLELALSKINISAESENDIRNAVNAGKVVTAHEQRINFNGWIGEGYTVIDPTTGVGGYLIAGGGNGGLLMPFLSGIGLGAAFAAVLGLFIVLTGPLAIFVLIAGLIAVTSVAIYNILVWDDEQEACFWTGAGVGAALAGILFAFFELFTARAAMKVYDEIIITRASDKIRAAIAAIIGGGAGIGTQVVDNTSIPKCVGAQ
jgi:hypothetical protein